MFKKTSSYRHDIEPDLLVGLDLGTSKVTVVVAERGAEGDEAQIIGVGQAPSNGIRKGLIVNLDQAVKSVRQAVSDAQNMVGQDIGEVTVAFGGGEVTSVRSKGMVSLGRTPRPVMRLDIERVIDAAQADVVVPANQTILHTIPVEYSLDGNVGIDDPLGMNAMRLDIEVQSIIVPTATIQNVMNCVSRWPACSSWFSGCSDDLKTASTIKTSPSKHWKKSRIKMSEPRKSSIRCDPTPKAIAHAALKTSARSYWQP